MHTCDMLLLQLLIELQIIKEATCFISWLRHVRASTAIEALSCGVKAAWISQSWNTHFKNAISCLEDIRSSKPGLDRSQSKRLLRRIYNWGQLLSPTLCACGWRNARWFGSMQQLLSTPTSTSTPCCRRIHLQCQPHQSTWASMGVEDVPTPHQQGRASPLRPCLVPPPPPTHHVTTLVH